MSTYLNDSSCISIKPKREVIARRCSFVFALSLVMTLNAHAQLASQAVSTNEISPAEQRLFVDDHLKTVSPGVTLNYSFTKRGSLESQIDDKAFVRIKRQSTAGREVDVQCLSGERKIDLPLEGEVKGNPMILCFLERDIREMKRLTGGSVTYYRKRIRMALAEAAKITSATHLVDGKSVATTEVSIDPYSTDPARVRFTKFANKTYRFIFSDAVPGGIVELRSLMHEEGKPASVMVEERLSYQK